MRMRVMWKMPAPSSRCAAAIRREREVPAALASMSSVHGREMSRWNSRKASATRESSGSEIHAGRRGVCAAM